MTAHADRSLTDGDIAALMEAARFSGIDAALRAAHKAGIAEGVRRERERCAKVCESKIDAEYATGKVDHNEQAWCQWCASAIRAGEEKP